MPGGGGPPVPLRSCCFPQPRHSRYRLPSGPRRRCQRWSPSLHRQGLAIVASLAMSRTGSMRATVGPMHPFSERSLPSPKVDSGYQSRLRPRSWAEPCGGRRRPPPGRRAVKVSSQPYARAARPGRRTTRRPGRIALSCCDESPGNDPQRSRRPAPTAVGRIRVRRDGELPVSFLRRTGLTL